MKLWIAQGFGIGRIPFAPGTFGSLLGLGWFALLLQTGSWWLFLAGIALGFGLSVWLCGDAAKQLGEKDPGSVVLDEIAAMPLCCAGFLAALPLLKMQPVGGWPGDWVRHAGNFTSPFFEVEMAATFVLFRLFDIWKPWPVRQSQKLSGGLGIVIDDFLAAVYVIIVMLAANLLLCSTGVTTVHQY